MIFWKWLFLGHFQIDVNKTKWLLPAVKTWNFDKNVNEPRSDGVVLDDEIEGVDGDEQKNVVAENSERSNRDGQSAVGTHRQWKLHAWDILRTFGHWRLPKAAVAVGSSHCRRRPLAACKCSQRHLHVASDLCRGRQTFSGNAGWWLFRISQNTNALYLLPLAAECMHD